jgi:hypothetical protein
MQAALQPRLTMTGPLLHGGGELHIVGNHDVTSIPDPDGALHRLVVLADGSRSTTELFFALTTDFPQLEEQDVVHAVSELASAGLFEDCAPRRGTLRARAGAGLGAGLGTGMLH